MNMRGFWLDGIYLSLLFTSVISAVWIGITGEVTPRSIAVPLGASSAVVIGIGFIED